jgi:hypothetical protein
MKLLLSLLLVSPFYAYASTPRACTQMGCDSGLFIEIPASHRWKKGAYRFEFLMDGKKLTCSGRLPLRPCDEPSVECDDDGVHIAASGCALPPSQHGFGDILVDSLPKSMELKVFHNKREIGAAKGTPAYESLFPNGKDCGPECRQGRLQLKFR